MEKLFNFLLATFLALMTLHLTLFLTVPPVVVVVVVVVVLLLAVSLPVSKH